jgi:hypothetical protein
MLRERSNPANNTNRVNQSAEGVINSIFFCNLGSNGDLVRKFAYSYHTL